ncbi:MAG: hypothetical protein R3B45_12880 [Bdellovibrionota bacterium]
MDRLFLNFCKFIFIGSFSFWSSLLLAQAHNDGSGLRSVVAADGVGHFKLNKDGEANDAFQFREAEVTFYAPIDHLFDGKLSLAAHREAGVSLFEMHEAVISSAKLIPYSSFRLGQYFLGIGRLNQIHRHDWSFISAPKVHREFFGEEGVLDTGGEYSLLLPLSFYLNITASVVNGWTYGHSHDEGSKPIVPTHYGRISTFWELSEDVGAAFGLNYLQRKAADATQMRLVGADAVIKWRRGSYNIFLIQGELWQRHLKPKVGDRDSVFGGYLFSQFGFSKSLFTGCRFDYYTVTSLKDANGKYVDNKSYAIVPTLTYKSSEFATFKLNVHHDTDVQAKRGDSISNTIELQTTFIIGAHPAHDF